MILRAEGISRSFLRESGSSNVFMAVEKTDFILPEGQLTLLMGRSGSGKTTFFNLLSGLLTPSDGRVFADGQDLYAMRDDARALFRSLHLGLIPQGQSGLGSLTVKENVLLPAALYGREKEREMRAEALMERLGIAPLREVCAGELSGGELRRMAIARGLVNDPEIIFADEPTGDLDDDSTKEVLSLFRSLSREGRSVLMVTHDREAAPYADRIFRMDKGVIRPEDAAKKE